MKTILVSAFLLMSAALFPADALRIRNCGRIPDHVLATLRDGTAVEYSVRFSRFTGNTEEIRKLARYRSWITSLAFENCPGFRMKWIPMITRTDTLTELHLSFNPVTDRDMPTLTRYRRLRSLTIVGTRITDRGARVFRRLQMITRLRIGKNHVLTGRTLDHIRGMKNLEELHIWETAIRGDSFRKLLRFRKLRKLSVAKLIRKNAAGGEGMKTLGRMTGLTFLDMGNSDIEDRDLRHIAGLKKLRFLNLGFSTIGDGAVPYLKGMRSLETLFIGWTKISRSGYNRLRAVLPRCRITR